jgi:hypothetical protein
MSRKSVCIGSGILLLFVGSAAATLLSLLRHEPSFYRRAAVPAGAERQRLSKQFIGDAGTFLSRVKDSDKWRATFSEEQINSFLEEGFVLREVKSLTLPEHITDPRVALEPDRIRLGFRYHLGQLSSVVSIDMRVWLTTNEPNVVALEIQGIRAGALPVSAQTILEWLSEAAERNNVKLSWYRLKGNPVAILRFQSEQRSNLLLDFLDLKEGTIDIQGQSLEPSDPIRPSAAKP